MDEDFELTRRSTRLCGFELGEKSLCARRKQELAKLLKA
jgi:hypothetical protein